MRIVIARLSATASVPAVGAAASAAVVKRVRGFGVTHIQGSLAISCAFLVGVVKQSCRSVGYCNGRCAVWCQNRHKGGRRIHFNARETFEAEVNRVNKVIDLHSKLQGERLPADKLGRAVLNGRINGSSAECTECAVVKEPRVVNEELASAAGRTIVAAAAGDGWEAVKHGVARLFVHDAPVGSELAEERLEQTRDEVARASAGHQEQQLASEWRDLLLDLLERRPGLAGEVRALVEQGVASRGAAAGRDMNIVAWNGGLAAGTIIGNVTLENRNPTVPGPAKP